MEINTIDDIISLLMRRDGIDEDKFPQLRICRSSYRMDNISIALRDDYNFNIQHLYDEVETENGYDIVVHVVRD